MSVGLLHATPWSFSFYFLQMVSRQQILEACLRIFLNAFHICLEISCSHPCLRKINLKGSKAMDPRLLAIILFHHFFSREIYIFFQGYLLLFTKFLFLFSLAKLKQGWDKAA